MYVLRVESNRDLRIKNVIESRIWRIMVIDRNGSQWQPFLKICDGPISNFFWTSFGYKLTRFHAFITKCTIRWNYAIKPPHYIDLEVEKGASYKKQY